VACGGLFAVNTIMEVAHNAGLLTAWSHKHPAYELFSGNSGTGVTGKIAEHGGDNAQDRHVPILVSGGPVGAGGLNGSAVETTQIAPTILQLLGLDPNALKAVQLEHTQLLPLGNGNN
jgi:hypothetical protein